MILDPVLLLSAKTAKDLLEWTSWGYLSVQVDATEGVILVTHFSDGGRLKLPVTGAWRRRHHLQSADVHHDVGAWYRCHEDVVSLHGALLARRLGTDSQTLASFVQTGWRRPTDDRHMPIVTVSDTEEGPRWTAWMVSTDSAQPAQLMIVEDDRQPLDYLGDDWPVRELADVHVTVVGVGSIGSAAADTLAISAVGRISLVDPDRLEQRNLARHRLTDTDLGRPKAVATRDRMRDCYPSTTVDPYPLNVIGDADVMRPLFAASDVIVCTADGVAARRVTNHLARRAGVPAVFAAVLEDGAFGELLRVRGRTGCLLCHRRALRDDGAMDPEPGLELGYGTGNPHRPMTAAPGDLAWMGTAAAKMAVATVLEARGRWNQRLPGDCAVVGLQPTPEMPTPFDLDRAGEIRWGSLPPSHPDCPTCTPP